MDWVFQKESESLAQWWLCRHMGPDVGFSQKWMGRVLL